MWICFNFATLGNIQNYICNWKMPDVFSKLCKKKNLFFTLKRKKENRMPLITFNFIVGIIWTTQNFKVSTLLIFYLNFAMSTFSKWQRKGEKKVIFKRALKLRLKVSILGYLSKNSTNSHMYVNTEQSSRVAWAKSARV